MTKSGNLKKIDAIERWMQLTDGTKIPLDDVADIESELLRDLFWPAIHFDDISFFGSSKASI